MFDTDILRARARFYEFFSYAFFMMKRARAIKTGKNKRSFLVKMS
ncbi:MAG: hypothetical protein SPF98_00065 [Campylobacter sp.]|nr:hypothetical protein [Campylobacter sp.]